MARAAARACEVDEPGRRACVAGRARGPSVDFERGFLARAAMPTADITCAIAAIKADVKDAG